MGIVIRLLAIQVSEPVGVWAGSFFVTKVNRQMNHYRIPRNICNIHEMYPREFTNRDFC